MIDIKPGTRLVIAHNPRSSRQKQVGEKVFARLDAAGYHYEKLEVLQAPLAENIAHLAPQIHAGDVIICAAGDGSAHAVMNSVIASQKPDVTLGFLAFGNFNDLPHTMNSRASLQDPVTLLRDGNVKLARSLDVTTDGKHLRYALLYVTLGWTAKAAAHFDQSGVRERSHRGKTGLARSLVALGMFYLKSRKNSLLPEFKIDNKIYHQTDILIANSTHIARLFHTRTRYYLTGKFLVRTLDVRTLLTNAGFLLSGLFTHISGNKHRELVIDFDTKSSVTLQCDGEVVELSDCRQLRIDKSKQQLAILTTK